MRAEEFTPAQIETIRRLIQQELARHDRQIEREEELNQQELDAADIKAITEWGELE
jgi:hypothetical protein